jgi:N,N'-diacetylchitobiose transport system substrate-binding protein
MRARTIAALAVVAVLGLAVPTAGADANRATAGITVWLQVDAESGWPDLVAATNAQFRAAHPGVDVNVQYKTWGTHLGLFDAALAGGTAPDVIEMGNTEMTAYMAAGAFQDLTSLVPTFANSANWLEGLAKSGRYNGNVYGIPYYAGSRVITYRTDLFKKAKVGIPQSLAQFTAAAKKLGAMNKDKSFSPVYIAGKDWYVAMGFVYDYGGQIAKFFKGKWTGTLDSPKAIAGLTAWKNFVLAASRASKTTDEARPQPYTVYAQGDVASMPGPAWFSCCVGDYKNVTKQFVMPSHTKGQSMPGFLGGSDLAVPVGGQRALAADWIRAFTDTQSQRALQAKGNIPNATNLLGTSVNERAAKRSWFTPQAKNWVKVEQGNILRTMLSQILTNKLTVKQAAAVASENITDTLNS